MTLTSGRLPLYFCAQAENNRSSKVAQHLICLKPVMLKEERERQKSMSTQRALSQWIIFLFVYLFYPIISLEELSFVAF